MLTCLQQTLKGNGVQVVAGFCALAVLGFFLVMDIRDRVRVRRESGKRFPLGAIVRFFIIAASVVVGYAIFCVLARGNVQPGYDAVQITVTHVTKGSEDRIIYCVDFLEEELRCYTERAGGNRELQWSKVLQSQALDEFVETCNREELLGAPPAGYTSRPQTDVYCYVTIYSPKEARVVFNSTAGYEKGLAEQLRQAFYTLTGVDCLANPA